MFNNTENSHESSLIKYCQYGQMTDPRSEDEYLSDLPDDISNICAVTQAQLIHYMTRPHCGLEPAEWKYIKSVNPFTSFSVLKTLKSTPHNKLTIDRPLIQRLESSCTGESILLATFLKHKGYSARLRTGFMINTWTGPKSKDFWAPFLKYHKELDTIAIPPQSEFQPMLKSCIEKNKYYEHWVVEYWDDKLKKWRLLDCRPEFLQGQGYEVDYFVSPKYFEYSWEAWNRIKTPEFSEERYEPYLKESQLFNDGRSWIRKQLLFDFYNLLNYEGAICFGSELSNFITDKKYSELSEEEILELDGLANLLSDSPNVDQICEYYLNSNTLRFKEVEDDKYAFIREKLNMYNNN